MAKNPLFRDEFYFYSSLYDDALITKFYNMISDSSYTRSKIYQKYAPGRELKSANAPLVDKILVTSFEEVAEFNARYEFPLGSKRYKLDNIVLSIGDKKKFLRTYGAHSQKIPLMDLRTNKCFSKAINIYFGPYRISTGYIVVDSDNSLYYVIPNDTTGITRVQFDAMLTDLGVFDIIFTTIETETIYSHSGSINSIKAGVSGSNTVIKIPKSPLVIIDRDIDSSLNSWECLITYRNSYGSNIMTSTNAIYRSMDTTTISFEISTVCINDVNTRLTSVSIMFINTPFKRHTYTYEYTSGVLPIADLEYLRNASYHVNVDVFEYDMLVSQKRNKLYSEDLDQSYFPNIFNFTSLNVNNKDLYIEVTEYPREYTLAEMHNSLKSLIDELSSNTYTSFVVNDYLHLDTTETFRNFEPTDFPVSFEDYASSEYYEEIRGYVLDKIVKTMETDSALYRVYLEFMESVVEPEVFNQQRFSAGFGGLNLPGTLFTGRNPVVTDTSNYVINEDYTTYFDEPHSFITFYAQSKKVPAEFFFYGTRVTPTITLFYNNLNYAFFPVSKIKGLLQIPAQLINDRSIENPLPPTIIDMYSRAVTSPNETVKDLIDVGYVGESFNIFDGYESDIKLSDIIMYDTSTGELIDVFEAFDITINANEDMLKPPEANADNPMDKVEFSYFYTVLNELYLTKDNFPIRLQGDIKELGLDNLIDDLITEGLFPDKETALDVLTNKYLPPEILNFILKDSSLIGKSIQVQLGNFTSTCIKTGEDVVDGVLSFDGINFSTDSARYDLYRNGQLLMHLSGGVYSSPISTSNKYGGDVTIDLTGNSSWTALTLPSAERWQSVCYGKDKFVAIVNNNSDVAAYSYDGINWTLTTLPNKVDWRAICYGDNKFVAISMGTKAAYSYDGIIWVSSELAEDDNWYSLAYGNGKYVAIPFSSSKAAYSLDGITWISTDLPSIAQWYSVCYGNGKYVTIAYKSNKAAYSTDGVIWTESTLPSDSQWYSICYGNGKYVAIVSGTDEAAYSLDGINWTMTTLPISTSWFNICYGDGKYIVVAFRSREAAFSLDGINWVSSKLPDEAFWSSVCYGDGKYIAVSGATSTIAAYSLPNISYLPNDVFELVYMPISYNNRTNTLLNKEIENKFNNYPYFNKFDPTGTSIPNIFKLYDEDSAITDKTNTNLLKAPDNKINIFSGTIRRFDSNGKRIAHAKNYDYGSTQYMYYNFDELSSHNILNSLYNKDDSDSKYFLEKYPPQGLPIFDSTLNRPLLDKLVDKITE